LAIVWMAVVQVGSCVNSKFSKLTSFSLNTWENSLEVYQGLGG